MLILTRKSHEVVVVGAKHGQEPFLTVTVLEIRGGSVRLGFEAAADVPVHRWEVWEKICAGARPEEPAAMAVELVDSKHAE